MFLCMCAYVHSKNETENACIVHIVHLGKVVVELIINIYTFGYTDGVHITEVPLYDMLCCIKVA